MIRPNYLSEIKSRISASENSAVFVSADFTDITDKKTASVGLTRLEADGLLKRVIRGVYYKPEYSDFLKEYIAPIPDNVAHAIARNFGWTIVPCGDTALNLLALSTQVPAVWLYVSDGHYKEYSYSEEGYPITLQNIPEDANVVYYVNGLSISEPETYVVVAPGSYSITAVITRAGYEELTLTYTIKIIK